MTISLPRLARPIPAWFVVAAVTVASLFASASALADAPGRAARLSDLVGDVQLANDRQDWQPVGRNDVIAAGDSVWVADGGRAELDAGGSTLWLAGGSHIAVEQLDDRVWTLRLLQGAMAVRTRAFADGSGADFVRVLTAHGDINLSRSGFYTTATGYSAPDASGGYAPVTLAVRRGLAEVSTRSVRQTVHAANAVVLDAIGVRYDRYLSVAPGSFEAWATARDRRIEQWLSRSAAYGATPWLIGARDLDDYGNWVTYNDYGRVWFPSSVAANWAPYRFGRWSWVQPWGWTWVDDAPWGFAPFHYGRWIRIGGRWAWCPGEYVARPVYAPALVTFFGGDGWSASPIIGPSYTWVPLGWGEPYVPWYTYTPTYWRQINRPVVREIAINSYVEPWRPHTYAHLSVPGAVTAVAAGALTGGRPVAQHYVRNLAEAAVRSAPPARMAEVVPLDRGEAIRPNVSAPGAPAPGAISVRERGPGPGVLPPAVNVPPARPVIPAPAGTPVQPNPSVLQPPVRQAPPAPSNPGMRDNAVPMPKPSAGRSEGVGEWSVRRDAPRYERERGDDRSPPRPLTATNAPAPVATQPAATPHSAPAPVIVQPAPTRTAEPVRTAPPAVVSEKAPVRERPTAPERHEPAVRELRPSLPGSPQ
ncbi:MAG: hypothetical protein JNL19_12280 [Burkholderiales bacterium]|nr:hypothetical protein [Burkholderiales bacterium]